jgi:hypothetical protein
MSREEKINNKLNIQKNEPPLNLQPRNNPAQLRREEDIFELIRDITEAESNNQLISYFNFVKFYGLLDPNNKQRIEEIENKQTKLRRSSIFGLGITLMCSFLFYKNSFKKLALYSSLLGSLPIYYFYYQLNLETNFELLEMKDEYIHKVEKFYKDGKNPIDLNPNFLAEDLVDPKLRYYQEILKMKHLKKI